MGTTDIRGDDTVVKTGERRNNYTYMIEIRETEVTQVKNSLSLWGFRWCTPVSVKEVV